jgi:hypothetical protein
LNKLHDPSQAKLNAQMTPWDSYLFKSEFL